MHVFIPEPLNAADVIKSRVESADKVGFNAVPFTVD
jgi:hypothetical protein